MEIQRFPQQYLSSTSRKHCVPGCRCGPMPVRRSFREGGKSYALRLFRPRVASLQALASSLRAPLDPNLRLLALSRESSFAYTHYTTTRNFVTCKYRAFASTAIPVPPALPVPQAIASTVPTACPLPHRPSFCKQPAILTIASRRHMTPFRHFLAAPRAPY